ncbi:MAG TPA: hypothetical protein VJH69_02675 [Candidatus Paceibacterota bacterium]
MTVIGFVGGAIIIGAYYLISRGVLSGTSRGYHALNLLGSVLLASDLFSKDAWSGVTLQVIFSAIAIWSLVRLTTLTREV